MNKMWEPEFEDWSEDKVSMSSCELATNSMSRGEYGVIMQIGTDEENLPVDAAIFWTDEMHLYLRYNWESWYKVSNDDPDNCACICKRNSATLLLCTTTSIKHHAVKPCIGQFPSRTVRFAGGRAEEIDIDAILAMN